MKNIKFSIVTNCYNSENEIEETMRSVISQQYRPLEYIIVDGNSNDATNDIIQQIIHENKDNEISFIYTSEPDRGIADAFNKGILKSTGDVIGLINSGDGLLPGALDKLSDTFANNPTADVVYGNTLCVDKDNNIRYLRRIPKNIEPKRFKYDGLGFTHQSAFVKKDNYDKIGLYDITYRYVMDSELFCKFADNNVTFYYLNETIVSMLAGGISSKPSIELLKEDIRIAEKYGGYNKIIYILNWLKGIPHNYIVRLLKRFPSIWNQLIGKERRYV